MSHLTKSDLGSAANSAQLTEASAGRFSRAVRLTIPTGGQAERAEVAPGTALNTLFQSIDVDATGPGAVEPAQLSTSGGQLVLTLHVARRVRRVRLKSPISGDAIAAFRFDGQVVSEDAVKTAAHSASGALLDVTDAALILKRRNSGDFPLTPGAIESISLRYAPVNPRLALRFPGQTGPGIPFPAQTDADGQPVFPADGTHGADLAAALSALLAGLPAPLPDPLEIDLLLSSDEPCSARIDAFDLRLVLESHGLAEKAVLRFSGRGRETRSVALSLPAGAILSGGSLTVSVNGAPPAVTSAAPAASPLPASSGEGLRLAEGLLAATRVELGEARVIVAATALIAAPDGPAELRAALHADRDGAPGKALVESEPISAVSARPEELRFSFAPTAIPSGPVWLVFSAISGSAVAMLGGVGKLARTTGADFVSFEDDLERGLVAALHPISQVTPGAPSGALSLRLGNSLLNGIPRTGSASLDLGPGLTALSGPATLQVTSAARGVVTLDPPLIRYGLA